MNIAKTKICRICKIEKSEEDFYIRRDTGGRRNECKNCAAELKKKYYSENKKNIIEKNKEYMSDEVNLKRKKEYDKKYYVKNKNKRRKQNREYVKRKRKNNLSFKIQSNLSRRINHVIKGNNKSCSTKEFIGCSPERLIEHLESQFQPGMTWENYGINGWHIDHIIPCSSFDLSNSKQQKECFHYTNLQPLWAYDNFKKSNKILSC